MLLIEYIVLGIIQGFTEPLPISSSGHLKVFKSLFTSNALSDINFEIVVNFGSLIAILFLYKNEIIKIIKDFFMYIKTKKKEYKTNYNYAWLIVIGTIPAGIVGILIKDVLEQYFTTKITGLMFIITALLLYLIKDKDGKKTKKDLKITDAIKIGLFQCIALIPGISRSGATVVGGIEDNLTKETAVDFSFMLYIPVSMATMVLGVKDLISANNLNELAFPYFISMIASMFVTYLSAKIFIDLVKKNKLVYFSIYCFILGILVFLIF